MAGANPQRTSWVSEEIRGSLYPQWYRPIKPYIPAKVPIIAANNLLYVTTAAGLYALNASNGEVAWTYATVLPLGHAPTIVGTVGYVGGFDHKLHAFNALTGAPLWQYEAVGGQGFETNPLVVNDTVYLGNRDGYFYAVWADTSSQKGTLRWRFKTNGPILFSAAYNQPTDTLYLASQDSYAYAVNAQTGQQVWKSEKLPGYGFHSWWPVVYTDPNTQKIWVIFSGSDGMRNMRPGIKDAWQLTSEETFYFFDPEHQSLPQYTPIGPQGIEPGNWVTGTTTLDLSKPNVVSQGTTKAVTEYFETKPTRRTYFVLDAQSGTEYTTDFDHDGKVEYAPILWHGTQSGNRYPPVVGSDGVLYQGNMLGADQYIGRSQISGWKLGTPFVSLSSGWQAVDEPQAWASGGKLIYWNLCCDRISAAFDLTLPYNANNRSWGYFGYNLRTMLANPPYYSQYFQDPQEAHVWDTYAGGSTGGAYGGHGNQNPPIPYNGKVYMHRSNAIIAWGPQSISPQAKALVPALTPPPVNLSLPTKADVTARLETEVQKMIQAGHLRPGFYADGIPGQVINRQEECMLDDYFHAPFDTHYVLLKALPHLNTTLQNQLKTYLQQEASQYPLTLTTTGWAGASRESFKLWDEIEADMNNFGPSPWGECIGNNGGWGHNPFQFYAIWKYAAQFGNALTHYNNAKGNLENPVSDALLLEHPHWLNAYLAGYYGYLELQKLAGQTQSATVKSQYDRLLNLRLNNFSSQVPASYITNDPAKQYSRQLTAARNFIFLVPEVADALRPGLSTQVSQAIDYYNQITPYWFVSAYDANVGEGVLQNLFDPHAVFQAKALILKEPYEELVKYLDVPAFERGDLFYIDNLVAALEAPYSGGTSTPTPTVVPGDANGDGKVDGVDYIIWLSHYSQNATGVSNGDFNSDNKVDGADYVIWLNHYSG